MKPQLIGFFLKPQFHSFIPVMSKDHANISAMWTCKQNKWVQSASCLCLLVDIDDSGLAPQTSTLGSTSSSDMEFDSQLITH